MCELIGGLVQAIAGSLIMIYYFSGLDVSTLTDQRYHGSYAVRINDVNNRTEAFWAVIEKPDLDVVGPNLTEEVKQHIQKACVSSDVIGVLVDQKLGGVANETFNVIPMNPSARETWRSEVTEPIYKYFHTMTNETVVTLTFIPFYDELTSTRPHSFAAVVTAIVLGTVEETMPSGKYLRKVLIQNPKRTEAAAPFIYNTGNITARGNQNCIYFTVEVRGKFQSTEDRVEMISAMVNSTLNNQGELNKCVKINGTRRSYRRLMQNDKLDQDVPGFLISKQLGGLTDDPYNVVPMNPRAIAEMKTQVEDPITAYMSTTKGKIKDNSVWLNIVVMYGDSNTTRPAGFIVRSATVDGGQRLGPIYIPN